VETIKFVCNEVRAAQDVALSEPGHDSSFDRFIKKARKVIDQSRRIRDVTPHGILGPLKVANVDPSSNTAIEDFSDLDLKFIEYFKTMTNPSSLRKNIRANAAGPAILKATNRYAGMDLNLTTAWVFLQELGVYSPFTNPAAVALRLPLSCGLMIDANDAAMKFDMVEDVLSGLRKDWGDLPVYCIDGVEAAEIDDGLSIEPADQPEEYWVHVVRIPQLSNFPL
jgi:hypothetical protein